MADAFLLDAMDETSWRAFSPIPEATPDASCFEPPRLACFCDDLALLDTLRLCDEELARLRSSDRVREDLPCCEWEADECV